MPKAQRPPARPPIDPEELAAFIDGRLEGERRRLMIERLAEDEDAYELYDEVVRVRAELAELDAEPVEADAPAEPPRERPGSGRDRFGDAPPVVRLPHRSRRPASTRPGLGWAAAAALAAAVLVGWLVIRPRGPVPSTELLARYDQDTLGPASAAVLDVLGPVLRGEGLSPAERAAYFKLGVRAFDLALAAEADDRVRARQWLEDIDRLLSEEVGFAFDHEAAYDEIARQLDAATSLSSLRPEIAAAEADLEDDLDRPEEPYVAFGRWVEAMRVAAATGDRGFLASREARRPLRRFLKLEPSPAVGGHLTAVATELDRGIEAANLGRIDEAMRAIRDECARGAACLGAADPGE